MKKTKKTISDISGFANNKRTINWLYVINNYNLTDEFIIEHKQYLYNFIGELIVTSPNLQYNAFEALVNAIPKAKVDEFTSMLYKLNIPNHTEQHTKLLLSRSNCIRSFMSSKYFTENLFEEWLIKKGKTETKRNLAELIQRRDILPLSVYQMIDSHIMFTCGDLINWNRVDIVTHLDIIEYYKSNCVWEVIARNMLYTYMQRSTTFTKDAQMAMSRIIKIMSPKVVRAFAVDAFNKASTTDSDVLINWIIENITDANWDAISQSKPIAPQLIDKFHDKLNMKIVYNRHKLTTKSTIINQMKALDKF